MSTLYRVIARQTNALQPGGMTNDWAIEVLYVGESRVTARSAYHKSETQDRMRGYGNPCRQTVSEVIEDAGTEDFSDDRVEVCDLDA